MSWRFSICLEKRVIAILETGRTGMHFFGLQPAIKHLRGAKTWTRACDALARRSHLFHPGENLPAGRKWRN